MGRIARALIIFLSVGVLFAQTPGRLAPGTGIVTGSIQMDGGGSLAGVRVAVVATDDPTGANLVSLADTDAAGHFRLVDIPQGHYYVVAGKLSSLTFFPGGGDRAMAKEIVVEAARTVSSINFKVPADSRRPPPVLTTGAKSALEYSAYERATNERNIYTRIKLLQGFEKSFPQSAALPRVYEDLLDSYIAKGDPNTAADYGEKWLVMDPDNVWALVQVSRAYGISQSDLREAVRYGEKAVATVAKLKALPPASRPAMFRGYTAIEWTSTINALDESAKKNIAWVRQVVAWHQNAINEAMHTRR